MYLIENTSQQLGNETVPYQERSWYCRPMADLFTLLQGAATVGERIRRLLDDKGMSLGELHRESGVAKGYLSELVNETSDTPRKPSAETLFAIGTVLGVSVGDLLGKTLPSSDEVHSWPPGLADYVRENSVPPEDARMLAGIRARGRSPESAEDWKHVHRTIEMYSEGRS